MVLSDDDSGKAVPLAENGQSKERVTERRNLRRNTMNKPPQHFKDNGKTRRTIGKKQFYIFFSNLKFTNTVTIMIAIVGLPFP